MVVRQVANDVVSTANKHISPRWFQKFISAPSILLHMDEDKAGLCAIEQVKKLSLAMKYVQVPQAKDINDFYQLTGYKTVLNWINTVLDT